MRNDGKTAPTPAPQPAREKAPQPAPSELRSFCEAVQELTSRDPHSRPHFERMVLGWARSIHNRLDREQLP